MGQTGNHTAASKNLEMHAVLQHHEWNSIRSCAKTNCCLLLNLNLADQILMQLSFRLVATSLPKSLFLSLGPNLLYLCSPNAVWLKLAHGLFIGVSPPHLGIIGERRNSIAALLYVSRLPGEAAAFAVFVSTCLSLSLFLFLSLSPSLSFFAPFSTPLP